MSYYLYKHSCVICGKGHEKMSWYCSSECYLEDEE
jgi:predicted nucleic acid-binding Zn ribbon protein